MKKKLRTFLDDRRQKGQERAFKDLLNIVKSIEEQNDERFNSLLYYEKVRVAGVALNFWYQLMMRNRDNRKSIKDWMWVIGVSGAAVTYMIKSIVSLFP